MIYVQRTSTVNIRGDEDLDVKARCKAVAPNYVRRTDHFIQLGILGLHGILAQGDLDPKTALFMLSGQGDLAVFERLCQQRYVEKAPPKPVDFINSLSNTAGFYLAKYAGLASKNLNLSQHGFLVENALLLAKASLETGQLQQLLVGGIDEKGLLSHQPNRYLGLTPEQRIGEGSNWLLLNAQADGALAEIDLLPTRFSFASLCDYLASVEQCSHVATGQRMPSETATQLVGMTTATPFVYQSYCDYYETNSLFAINLFIESMQGSLLYIDYFEQSYRVIKVQTLG